MFWMERGSRPNSCDLRQSPSPLWSILTPIPFHWAAAKAAEGFEFKRAGGGPTHLQWEVLRPVLAEPGHSRVRLDKAVPGSY